MKKPENSPQTGQDKGGELATNSSLPPRDTDVNTHSKNFDKKNKILSFLQFLHPHGEAFEVCIAGPQVRKHRLWNGEYANGTKAMISGWFKTWTSLCVTCLRIGHIGIATSLPKNQSGNSFFSMPGLLQWLKAKAK